MTYLNNYTLISHYDLLEYLYVDQPLWPTWILICWSAIMTYLNTYMLISHYDLLEYIYVDQPWWPTWIPIRWSAMMTYLNTYTVISHYDLLEYLLCCSHRLIMLYSSDPQPTGRGPIPGRGEIGTHRNNK